MQIAEVDDSKENFARFYLIILVSERLYFDKLNKKQRGKSHVITTCMCTIPPFHASSMSTEFARVITPITCLEFWKWFLVFFTFSGAFHELRRIIQKQELRKNIQIKVLFKKWIKKKKRSAFFHVFGLKLLHFLNTCCSYRFG